MDLVQNEQLFFLAIIITVRMIDSVIYIVTEESHGDDKWSENCLGGSRCNLLFDQVDVQN